MTITCKRRKQPASPIARAEQTRDGIARPGVVIGIDGQADDMPVAKVDLDPAIAVTADECSLRKHMGSSLDCAIHRDLLF
ncbi:hypothetical protein [Paracoccus methylarcula]|uniref:hypothetical protein n=1 Tax=Paracoccus methylarcula TaxID=72022 RepID=UPI00147647BA|nr:hypothetical protein [Paracoccus methylarcula]